MLPNYNLSNIVFKSKLVKPITKLSTLEVLLPHTKRSGRNSSICVYLPKASVLIKRSGRLLVFKCKNEQQCYSNLNELSSMIQDIHLEFNFTPPTICNIVGTIYLGHNIDLGKWHLHLPKSEYNPDHHVSLFARIGGVAATITYTGKATVFGVKTISYFDSVMKMIVEIDSALS